MFGWFKTKSALADDRRDWIEWRFQWLLQEFGDGPLLRPIVTPSDEFFPDPYSGTRPDVELLFQRVCTYMDVDRSRVQLSFFRKEGQGRAAQQSALTGGYALGLYNGQDSGKLAIWLEESELDEAESVVATLAHELCHVHLLADGHLTGEEIDHEHVTDLLTTFFGMGIFTANSIRKDRSWVQGPLAFSSVSYQGYLQMPEAAYALALRAYWRREKNPTWAKFLRSDVRADVRRDLDDLYSEQRSVSVDIANAPNPFKLPEHKCKPSEHTCNEPQCETQEMSASSNESTQVVNDEVVDDPMFALVHDLNLDDPADKYFAAGTVYASQSNHLQAVEAFSRSYEMNPEDTEALLNRASSNLALGNFAQSIADVSRRLESDPRDLQALWVRAEALMELNRYEEALQDTNAAMAIEPAEFSYYFRGLAHFALGQLNRAISDLNSAITKRPSHAEFYFARSRVHLARNQVELSDVDLKEAIRWNPDLEQKDYQAALLASRIVPIR